MAQKNQADGHKLQASTLHTHDIMFEKKSLLAVAQCGVCTDILLLDFEWQYPNIL